MGDLPVVSSRPALRCHGPIEDRGFGICGELARWMRVSAVGALVGYVCDHHRAADDVPIPRVVVFDELYLALNVLIAGAATSDSFARAEAVARIERALELVGASVSVRSVSSRRVRCVPPPAPGYEKRHRGGLG